MNYSLKRVKAAQAMTMVYTGLIWSSVAGVLFFREYPNLISGAGDAIIVLSTLLFALRSTGVFRRKPPVSGVQQQEQDLDEPLLPQGQPPGSAELRL